MTETFRDGAGFIRRKTRTYGGPPKPVAKGRRRKNDTPVRLTKWHVYGFIAIVTFMYVSSLFNH